MKVIVITTRGSKNLPLSVVVNDDVDTDAAVARIREKLCSFGTENFYSVSTTINVATVDDVLTEIELEHE